MFLGLVSVVIGYLLGSIPAAYIVTKYIKGIDIREVDTGNVGAGSVIRQVGRRAGAVVAVTDIAKGSAAIVVAQALGVAQPWVLAAGFAAILGHGFPVYIGFRGGQGIATIMGIFFVLAPGVMGITCGILALALLFTRRHLFVSIAIAAPFFPLLIWQIEGSVILIIYSLAIVAFVAFRSRRRLILVKTVTIRSAKEVKAIACKAKIKKKVVDI